MNRHSTCISMCIMKHVLKQQKNIHLQVSHQPRWAVWWLVTAGTRSMAEVPQKMLSGARAAQCHLRRATPLPPHSVAFFRATQARGFCHTTPNLNPQFYWIKPISNKLSTFSPNFSDPWPLDYLVTQVMSQHCSNCKPYSECWEQSWPCFVQLGQAEHKSGRLFVPQLIFLIKNANSMQV